MVLSAAAYIVWRQQTLEHPWYPGFDLSGLPNKKPDYKCENLSLHPLFEAWCDIIVQAILDGFAVRQHNELYIAIHVSFDYLTKIKEFFSE